MSILALIPARGGSKGIPRKNLKPLGGKPLIGWTIEAARQARSIDCVVVSTEDMEIASLALELGVEVPFMRPVELAADETPGIAPVLHALEQLPDFEWVLLLQPTSPLRTAADIDGIIEFCLGAGCHSAVSVSESASHPYWMYTRAESGRLESLLPEAPSISRRQELPAVYELNGALYFAARDWLLEHRSFVGPGTLGYVMPPERSVDLDTPRDWLRAEYLIEKDDA
ncbi:MAG: cytidylyltransferase domain-containing protein [Gammaproteobacteria bacterium]